MQKITIIRDRDGKPKIEGLRHDQILVENPDGKYSIFIKKSKL